VPVIVLRDKTEYHELLDAGVIFLAGTEQAGIVEAVNNALDREDLDDALMAFARKREAQSSIGEILDGLARVA